MRYIFGLRTGDTIADSILESLRSRGSMNQTDISNLFGRHASSNRLGTALKLLHQLGHVRQLTKETGGRPETIWELGARDDEKRHAENEVDRVTAANNRKAANDQR